MRSKKVSGVLLLASFVLLLALAAGCGGEEGAPEQTAGQDDGDTAAETDQQQDAAGEQATQAEETAAESDDQTSVKIALGTIQSVDPATRNLELDQVEGGLISFRLLPEVRVIVDEQAGGPADLRVGQQAQVRYVVRDDSNQAQSVRAFSNGE